MKEQIKKNIKETAAALGADVCGIANIDRFTAAPNGFLPTDHFPECRSVIVFGIALSKGVAKTETKMIYGHFNYKVCPDLDLIAFRLAKEIEQCFGGFAIPLPSDGPYEYWDAEKKEGRGLLSMKHAAVLAGIGTMGKSTIFLNEKYGNLLTLGSVLSDLDLPSDPPAETICLEGCSLCLDNCPTQALDGNSVNQKKCREYTYATTARGFEVVRCNRCRMICPMRFGK